MSEDMQMAARTKEFLELQNNKVLLSQLSDFQIVLNDVYETTRPTFEDYAKRRDMIRKMNDIARQIYGDNDNCPVVESFGSFIMDMFNAESDLDLSINFSDQSLENGFTPKRKILQKFAKKFFNLKSKGKFTTVERSLSHRIRVPILKVTDSETGINCDFSVGNRDGIAKSHILLMISAIDERFQQLSFMMKAWAKTHDINNDRDNTLSSLSLILLAAFHLQTRDIPILPPFSAILKDGMDPPAVKKIIPSFLNYGERNKESLAELFVSLLVKLESVDKLWSRGLCASTHKGSWIHINTKSTVHMSIEDFTDRSQCTARIMQSKGMKKIYSCIHHSVELIRSFTKGVITPAQLKSLLFGLGLPVTTVVATLDYLEPPKPVCSDPNQEKKKRKKKWQKSGRHGHHPFRVEGPIPSKTSGVKEKKRRSEIKTDPVTSETPTSFQGLGEFQDSRIGSCQPHLVLPIHGSTGRPQKAEVEFSNNATPTFQAGQPYYDQSNLGYGISDSQRNHVSNFNHVASSLLAIDRPSLSNPFNVQCGGYGPQKASVNTLSHADPRFPEDNPAFISNLQGFGSRPDIAHVENLRHAAPNLPQREYEVFRSERSQRTDVETLRHSIPSFPSKHSLSHSYHQHFKDYGEFRSGRDHADTLNLPFSSNRQQSKDYGGFRSERYHVDMLNQPFSHSIHQHSQDTGRFRRESHHVDTSRHSPNLTADPWVSVFNQPVQDSGGLLPRMYVATPHYSSPYSMNLAARFGPEKSCAGVVNHTITRLQPAPYTLSPKPSSFIPPHQPYHPSASPREPADLQMSHNSFQDTPVVLSHYAAYMHSYQSQTNVEYNS